MKFLVPFTLLTAQGANGSGAAVPVKQQQDAFIVFPVTAGGTVALTVAIEVKSPAGNWHQVATATYNAAGNQAPIKITDTPTDEIRATVSGWTNGTVSITGTMGASSR